MSDGAPSLPLKDILTSLGELAAFETDLRVKETLYRATSTIRALSEEREALRISEKEARSFESLLRQIISIVPAAVEIVPKDIAMGDWTSPPTRENSIIAVKRDQQIWASGIWLQRLRESLAWYVVRARDIVEEYDARKEKEREGV